MEMSKWEKYIREEVLRTLGMRGKGDYFQFEKNIKCTFSSCRKIVQKDESQRRSKVMFKDLLWSQL